MAAEPATGRKASNHAAWRAIATTRGRRTHGRRDAAAHTLLGKTPRLDRPRQRAPDAALPY